MLFGPISKISLTGFVLVTLAFVGYFYWTQIKFDQNAKELAEYQTALDQTVQAIDDLQSGIKRSTIGLEKFENKSDKVRQRALALSRYLSLVDLAKMAATNPYDMEQKVNAATREVLEELRRITDKNWIFIEDTQTFKEVEE